MVKKNSKIGPKFEREAESLCKAHLNVHYSAGINVGSQSRNVEKPKKLKIKNKSETYLKSRRDIFFPITYFSI